MRVLLKGPSTLLWTSWMGGPRGDMAFPRVIEQELLRGGRAAEVRNTGVLGWPTRDLFATWDEDVAAWSPDILILAVGHYESLHLILPRWLERGANTPIRRAGRFKLLHYRRLALRLLARGVLHLQKRIDSPRFTRRGRMKRVIDDTATYIKLCRQVGTPLILLMEIHTPSAAKSGWFGGWTARIHNLNEDLRELASGFDDSEVRFVSVTDLMSQFDPATPENLWADGIHFSPEFHRAIGVRFAAIAEDWAGTQPHLARP